MEKQSEPQLQQELDCSRITPYDVIRMQNIKLFTFRKNEIYPSILPPVSQCNPEETEAWLSASIEANNLGSLDSRLLKNCLSTVNITKGNSKDKSNEIGVDTFCKTRTMQEQLYNSTSKLRSYDVMRMQNCKSFDFQMNETYPNIRPPVNLCNDESTAEWLAKDYDCRRPFDMENDDIVDVWKQSPKKDTLGYYGVSSDLQSLKSIKYNQLVSNCLDNVSGRERGTKKVTEPTAASLKCEKPSSKAPEVLFLNRSMLEYTISKMPNVQKNLQSRAGLSWINCHHPTSDPFPKGQPVINLALKQPVPQQLQIEPKNYEELYSQLASCFKKGYQDPITASYNICCQGSAGKRGAHGSDEDIKRIPRNGIDSGLYVYHFGGGDGFGENQGKTDKVGSAGAGNSDSTTRKNKRIGDQAGGGKDPRKVLRDGQKGGIESGPGGIRKRKKNEDKTADKEGGGRDKGKFLGVGRKCGNRAGEKRFEKSKKKLYTSKAGGGKDAGKVDGDSKKGRRGQQPGGVGKSKMTAARADKGREACEIRKPLKIDNTMKRKKCEMSISEDDIKRHPSSVLINTQSVVALITEDTDPKSDIFNWKEQESDNKKKYGKEMEEKRRRGKCRIGKRQKIDAVAVKCRQGALEEASKDCPCEICSFMDRHKRDKDPPYILEMLREQKRRQLMEYYRQQAYVKCRKAAYQARQHKCDPIESEEYFYLDPNIAEYFDCVTALKNLEELLCSEQNDCDHLILLKVRHLKDRLCYRLNQIL